MDHPTPPDDPGGDRRDFLSLASNIAMGTGLVCGYGTLGYFAAQYVYPNQPRKLAWQVVTTSDRIKPGDSLRYESPAGELITITRRVADAAKPGDDYLVLSSVCPHLGCKVHWESQQNRFFCPCHNGAFDPQGVAIAGPPKEAGQSLKKYEVRVDANGVVQVLVPTDLLG